MAICATYDTVNKVFLPLMPKGVEHNSASRSANWSRYVFLPLMPKGVEHPHTDGWHELRPKMCFFR